MFRTNTAVALFLLALSAPPVAATPVAAVSPHERPARDLDPRLENSIQLPPAERCGPTSPDGIQIGCWESLQMNDYLRKWWDTNSARCKDQSKGFAACYLDTAGYLTWACDFISLNACLPPPSGPSANYSSSQEFYTFWNIYAINLFFTNYHAALMQGQAAAIGHVGDVVALVSPPRTIHKQQVVFSPIWSVSLSMFSIGSTFLTMVGGAWLSVPFSILVSTLYGGNGLYTLLWPKTDVIDLKWETIAATLSENVDQYQQRVGEALNKIMTDYDTFYAIASPGFFSQKFKTNLPEDTDFMYRDLLKWVFNEALTDAGWFIVKNPGVDPRLIPTDAFECTKLDVFDKCGPLWYDGKDSYGLARANDIGMNMQENFLQVAFTKNWTTPQELFIDAQSCQGKNSSEGFDVENLSLSCVSNLPVCEFYYDFNPYEYVHGNRSSQPPEFVNCPNQKGYGLEMFTLRAEAGVPLTYLGPWLMSGAVFNEVASAPLQA